MRHTARLLCGTLFLLAPTTILAQAPPAKPPAETPATPAPQPPAKGAETPAKPAAPAAPAPAPAAKDAATGDYYPLKAGTKWVYKVGEVIVTVKVAGEEKGGGTKLETEVNGKTVASEVIQVTAEAIVRTKINNSEIKPPVAILKLTGGKATKGDKWTVNSTIQGQTDKGDFATVDDKVAVEVPAGKYTAVAVEGEFDIAGTKTAVKYYFAPGVGIVKQSYSIMGNEAVLELKEFTPGK
jgi:hypothetical protein